MAFKRNGFKSLVGTRREFFSSDYKFTKRAKFEIGSDVYIIPLGLEDGYYETPCHAISPHKVDGQMIGFNGTSFKTYVKCEGCDENGNKSDALCCRLAKLEKERIPERDDSFKRIVSFTTSRIHLPVLILGNSLKDTSKISYPVSKVAILGDLHSESGLNFSYIDMAAQSFKQDIIIKYGNQLKDAGVLEYELSEESEDFYEEVRKRLVNTIIKVHGVSKQGFSAALKEYSFYPFDNPAIASGSPEGEREAIINYKKNKEIVAQIDQFMTLFNVEVDNLIPSWNEKDLQEYYNSAIGVDLKTPIKTSTAPVEKVEVVEKVEIVEKIEEKPVISEEPVTITAEDEAVLAAAVSQEDSWEEEITNVETSNAEEVATSDSDDFEFDSEEGDDFFAD